MATRVVHLAVRPLPDNLVRISRPGRWGNPYTITDKQPRPRVIELYRAWLAKRLLDEPDYLEPLRGKVLGCWCKPMACHGDVIAEYLDR